MAQLLTFPNIEPAATIDFTVDFGLDLPVGVTLTSSVWALTVRNSGPTGDPNPSSRLDGPSSISGTMSTQRITNMIDGVDYLVTILGYYSDGEIVEFWTTISCRAPA